MKVVILAGGLGTRISEESHLKPKPMIEVGGRPILWHIMKIYSHFGFNDFVICCGYKSYVIKEYFNNYYLHSSDITFDFRHENSIVVHNNIAEPWKVTLVDTGLETMTGGRIKRVRDYLKNDESFLLTYGDGVSNVNITELVKFHKNHGKIATLTSIQPSGRFGVLDIDENQTVLRFDEKPDSDGTWINGGFFVFNKEIFDYIDGDMTYLEREPLNRLANERQLAAFEHTGFWRPMDTLRDNQYLDQLWNENRAPWKLWN